MCAIFARRWFFYCLQFNQSRVFGFYDCAAASFGGARAHVALIQFLFFGVVKAMIAADNARQSLNRARPPLRWLPIGRKKPNNESFKVQKLSQRARTHTHRQNSPPSILLLLRAAVYVLYLYFCRYVQLNVFLCVCVLCCVLRSVWSCSHRIVKRENQRETREITCVRHCHVSRVTCEGEVRAISRRDVRDRGHVIRYGCVGEACPQRSRGRD